TEPFRTGAGHIHIGWTDDANIHDPEHFEKCRDVVRQLDCILYPLSMSWDSDQKRRDLYGKMGSFRPKFYGVEYRPLSNAILGSDDTLGLIFDETIWAVNKLNEGVYLWHNNANISMIQE